LDHRGNRKRPKRTITNKGGKQQKPHWGRASVGWGGSKGKHQELKGKKKKEKRGWRKRDRFAGGAALKPHH